MFHFIVGTLGAQNDPPYLLITANAVEIHHMDLKTCDPHLIDGNIKHDRLVELRI